jgi:hypothetical protein
MPFFIYATIINGLDTRGKGGTKRRGVESLKFTVYLKLPNIELMPSEVE